MTLSAMTQQVAMVLAVACSVGVIRLSQLSGGRGAEAALADFRAVLLAMGLAGALAALSFLRLAASTGAAVLARPPACR